MPEGGDDVARAAETGLGETVERERAGEYDQTGSLGTGTQGDSIARELARRDEKQIRRVDMTNDEAGSGAPEEQEDYAGKPVEESYVRESDGDSTSAAAGDSQSDRQYGGEKRLDTDPTSD